MKQIVLLSGALVLMAASSFANVSFRWNSAAPHEALYWDNSPTTPKTYADTPAGWTVLTYISGDVTVDFNSSSTFVTGYGSGLGADIFVGSQAAPLAGVYSTAPATYGAAGAGAGSYVGSYAYFVLVAMPFTTFTGIYGGDVTLLPVGTLFGVSSVSAALTQKDTVPTPGPTQAFDVGVVRADIALVPEPSTFALLGIGLGLVGLRRFRRK